MHLLMTREGAAKVESTKHRVSGTAGVTAEDSKMLF